jgi:hypothetical protein
MSTQHNAARPATPAQGVVSREFTLTEPRDHGPHPHGCDCPHPRSRGSHTRTEENPFAHAAFCPQRSRTDNPS